MKHLSKAAMLLLLLLAHQARAQFTYATFAEANDPLTASVSADRAGTVNAYSHSNVTMELGGVHDLSIHAWNSFDPYAQNNNGIAWQGTGSPGILAAPDSIQSVDIGLVQDAADTVYALLVYHSLQPGLEGNWLKVYRWREATSGLDLIDSIQLNTDPHFDWIHIDVNDLDSFVVTWGLGNKMFARAGQVKNSVSGHPEMESAEVVVDDGSGAGQQQPDVALSSANTVGQLMAHFVYLDAAANRMKVCKLTLSDIYSNPGSVLTATLEDTYAFPNMTMPRIDCPDHSQEDDWANTVSALNVPGEYILSSVNAPAVSGAPQHFILNNGSLMTGGGGSMLDITNNNKNEAPVVAYDNDSKYLYYLWYVGGPVLNPFGTGAAYIGMRMDHTGTLQDTRYWFVAMNPAETGVFTAFALSGQNDASDSLYMSFATVPSGNYQMTYKKVEWGSPTNSFRPTGIDNMGKEQISVGAFPNPFRNGFMLYANGLNRSAPGEAVISDLSGRQVFRTQGTIGAMNRSFSQLRLEPGVYLLNLHTAKTNSSLRLISR